MRTQPKFCKGAIVTLTYDKAIKNEIIAYKWNGDGECWNYKVRQYSKYGEHGIKEIAEPNLIHIGTENIKSVSIVPALMGYFWMNLQQSKN